MAPGSSSYGKGQGARGLGFWCVGRDTPSYPALQQANRLSHGHPTVRVPWRERGFCRCDMKVLVSSGVLGEYGRERGEFIATVTAIPTAKGWGWG